MSDRKIAISSLVIGALGLFVGLFFGLRSEGFLRFENWEWNTYTYKTISVIGSIASIIGVVNSIIFFNRNKRAEDKSKPGEEGTGKPGEEGTGKPGEEGGSNGAGDGMVRINEYFDASIDKYDNNYVVSVKYNGSDSVFIKVYMRKNDVCKILSQDLENKYLNPNETFFIELERTVNSRIIESCILIKSTIISAKIKFNVNSAKILNGINESV